MSGRGHVRYMVDDVDAAVAFYTTHFGFTCSRARRLPSPISRSATCGSC